MNGIFALLQEVMTLSSHDQHPLLDVQQEHLLTTRMPYLFPFPLPFRSSKSPHKSFFPTPLQRYHRQTWPNYFIVEINVKT
jgi:hypothetical protein